MLTARAEAGPSLAPVAAPTRGGRFTTDEVAVTAVAPLRAGEAMVGLLSMGLPSSRIAIDSSDLLAATIDYAGVASAVLGPSLDIRGRETSARREIRDVLAAQAFHPVFQPVVDLASGQAVGFEALTRFDDGVAPDLRFAEAARLGIERQLEEAVIARILAAAEQLPARKWLGVNVSPADALDTDWLARVLGDAPRRIVMELTEHTQIEDYVPLRAALGAVRSDRLRVAVDDAGAGYASMRHILELRPDFVKLDISLVRGVQEDTVRQALIAGLSFFASRTGSQLIAEGIETDEEAAALRMLRVPFGQGYLLGRPAPVGAWAKA